MPIRMVAIDLDGTLIHSSGIVTERNLQALHAAKSAGVQVVIATGRRHSYAMRVLQQLSMDASDIVLSSNGTVARRISADLIFRESMSLETARLLCRTLSAFRDALVLTFDLVTPNGEDTHGALVLERIDELHASIRAWIEANAAYIRRVVPIESILAGPEAMQPIQAMLCGTMDRMDMAEAALGTSPAGDLIDVYRTEYPGRDLCIVDLLPRGSSKGAGLLRLAEQQGILPGEIMTIGDNWNDVPMLRIAGRAVLMRNAPDDLLNMAEDEGWEIGASHDDDAVAEAIESAIADAPRTQRAVLA